MIHRKLAALSLLALAGCVDGCDDGSSEPGELQNGRFRYTCVGHSDIACETRLLGEDAFPPVLAVDGHFRVTYDGWGTDSASVEPASPWAVRPEAGVFSFYRPGPGAFLAWSRDGRAIHDFLNLAGAEVAAFEIAGVDGSDVGGTPPDRIFHGSAYALRSLTEVRLQTGRAQLLLAIPVDYGGTPLGGALAYRWSVGDETIATVDQPADNLIRVDGLATGFTTLRLESADLVVDLPVIVEDGR